MPGCPDGADFRPRRYITGINDRHVRVNDCDNARMRRPWVMLTARGARAASQNRASYFGEKGGFKPPYIWMRAARALLGLLDWITRICAN